MALKKLRVVNVSGGNYRYNPAGSGCFEFEDSFLGWRKSVNSLHHSSPEFLETCASLKRDPYVKTEVRPRVVKVSEDSTCWFKIVNRELWFTGAGEKGWVRADFAGDYSDGWREAIAECILNPTEEVEVDG